MFKFAVKPTLNLFMTTKQHVKFGLIYFTVIIVVLKFIKMVDVFFKTNFTTTTTSVLEKLLEFREVENSSVISCLNLLIYV